MSEREVNLILAVLVGAALGAGIFLTLAAVLPGLVK
jgi:hypothetical protein